MKERWEQEVLAALQRQEQRLDRFRQGLVPRLPTRPRDHDERLPVQLLIYRPAPRRDSQLELFAGAKRAVRVAREIEWARHWLRFGWRSTRLERNPEKAARRVVLRLASKVVPRGIRVALSLLRGFREIRPRER